jgi:hypothetical protein
MLALRMDVCSDDFVWLGLEKWFDIYRRLQHRSGFLLLFLVEKLICCGDRIY